MEVKLQGYTKNKLKISSLSMTPRNWKQQDALALDMPVTPLCMADTMNPVEIDISAGGNLQEDDDNFKQTQTLAMICEQYPPEVWTNVYTDGSATNAIHVLPFTSLEAAQ